MNTNFIIPANNWGFIDEKKIEQLNNIFEIVNKDGFFPDNKNVLRFLNMDINNIKYIIVGMEPYPSSYLKGTNVVPEATGRSFEVSSIIDKTWSDKFKQSSLRNILKTIYYNEVGEMASLDDVRKKIESNEFKIASPGQWFDKMESQGVLFLNATLTVRPSEVGSHTEYWADFMNDLIVHINNNTNAKWLLWGNDAKNAVLQHVAIEKCIITCHPRLAQFVSENCFKYANEVNWTGLY